MSPPDLAARIARIEAQAAIADLVHHYARAVRRNEPERVEELFMPNGTFEVRTGHPDRPDFTLRTRFASPQALVAFLVSQKGGPHPVPLIHNLIVTVEGDSATAESVMVATIHGTDKQVRGEYADSFARVDGRWLFCARIYTIYES